MNKRPAMDGLARGTQRRLEPRTLPLADGIVDDALSALPRPVRAPVDVRIADRRAGGALFAVFASLADGTALDLLTRGHAENRSERYSDALYTRWVKVRERIASAAYTDYRLECARHFFRTRNLHLRPGDVALERFEIRYVERVIRPPGEGPPTFREITLWSHRC